MCGDKRFRDLGYDPERILRIEPGLPLQQLADASSRNIILDDVVHAVVGISARIMYRDQIGMPDLAGKFRLADEPVDELLVLFGDVRGEDFQGEKGVEDVVSDKIDGPHPAAAEQFYDGVLLENRARLQNSNLIFFRSHGSPPYPICRSRTVTSS